MTPELLAAFVGGLAPQLRPPPEKWPELATVLATMVEHARARWPDVLLPTEAFIIHVAGRIAAEPELAVQLERIAAADLWLACGCCRGDSRAITAFERTYAP